MLLAFKSQTEKRARSATLWSFVALILPMNLPIAAVFLFCAGNAALPEPTGPYRVGTTVRHFVDSRRTDPVDPKHKREIMAQYWFPTEQSRGAMAAYLSDPRLLGALLAGPYYGQTPEVLNSWGGLRTHAFLDAGVSRRQKWPILLLEPGLGMPRANYTSYCEDLASHGYFVAAIDPPHGGLTVLPDGRVLDAGDDAANSDPSRQAAKTSEWAGDMSFVLNRLQAESARLSLAGSKVGALGHSMGGSAAFQTALGDKRVLAALDLDGSGGVVGLESGARVPLLMVKSNPNYSDTDLAKLGRTRAQWEARGKMGPKMFPPLAVGAHSAPV